MIAYLLRWMAASGGYLSLDIRRRPWFAEHDPKGIALEYPVID
jgi:hypothetical protein